MEILLSKSTMPLIKWVAELLGLLMNGIYFVLDKMNIGNIALAIIIFTIIIYLILTPIQISQQKSSKVMSAIQPELQKIQKKYQGKRDQASQMKMQQETMDLYSKYGVSPTGSCLPMLIQLPILFALYQVIYHIPGYISKIGNMFSGLASKIVAIDGYSDLLTNFISENSIRVQFRTTEALTQNNVIDTLYVLKPAQWEKLSEMSAFSSIKTDINALAASSSKINSFAGINISESPWDAIQNGFASISAGTVTAAVILSIVVAILIPVLAWFTQWLNVKLMPQQVSATDASGAQMANSMKSMNMIMPLFSAVLCVTFSMGIGIYWVIGAVVRCVQQVVINRKIVNVDMEAIEAKAAEKREKKNEKRKDYTKNLTQNAHTSVKNIENTKYDASHVKDVDYYEKSKAAPANSLTAKANMVRAFDERNAAKKSGKNKAVIEKKVDTTEEVKTEETQTVDSADKE